MIYTDEMFNTQGESTTLADMNIGTSASTGAGYVVPTVGRLLKVTLIWAGEAATSLFEYLRIELNCPIWLPNTLRFGIPGGGLRTAPAFPVPPTEWAVDQPVQPQQQIKGQYIYADAATPVTCNARVLGTFTTG